MPVARPWIVTAACLGLLGVAMGAFGAHALRAWLPLQMMTVFETGVRYHLFHVLALLATAGLMELWPRRAVSLRGPAWLFLAGIVLFSGSLYAYALSGWRPFAWVTPVGGLAWIVGWGALAMVAWRTRRGGRG